MTKVFALNYIKEEQKTVLGFSSKRHHQVDLLTEDIYSRKILNLIDIEPTHVHIYLMIIYR